jgi:hypothetical protein
LFVSEIMPVRYRTTTLLIYVMWYHTRPTARVRNDARTLEIPQCQILDEMFKNVQQLSCIWDSHSRDCEQDCLLGCDAVQSSISLSLFQRNVLQACLLLLDGFGPDHAGSMFLRNVKLLSEYTVSHPRRCYSSSMITLNTLKMKHAPLKINVNRYGQHMQYIRHHTLPCDNFTSRGEKKPSFCI